MGLNWTDRVPHEEILARAGLTSIEAVILTRQLRWLGHVVRMPGTRLPKMVLFGELAEGQRPHGRPMKRYRDHMKKVLLSCAIDPSQLENLASDRNTWRSTITTGMSHFEAERNRMRRVKRQRRNQQRTPNPVAAPWICWTCRRGCGAAIGLFSHERTHPP